MPNPVKVANFQVTRCGASASRCAFCWVWKVAAQHNLSNPKVEPETTKVPLQPEVEIVIFGRIPLNCPNRLFLVPLIGGILIGDTKTHPTGSFFTPLIYHFICYIPIPPMKGTRKLPFFPQGHWKDCGDPQSHAGRWAHLSSSASRHVLH